MPTIERIGHKRRYEKKKEYSIIPNNHRAFIEKIYNSRRWRAMREMKLRETPLCEICEKDGRITPATQVHHQHEISLGLTENDMLEIAFDYNNLQSLCERCHMRLHGDRHRKRNKQRQTNDEEWNSNLYKGHQKITDREIWQSPPGVDTNDWYAGGQPLYLPRH